MQMRSSRTPSLKRARAAPRRARCQGLRMSLALCLAGLILAYAAAPLSARPPSKCRLGNQSEYRAMADATLSEDTRKELRLRVLIDALDDVDIVFRGRLAKRWYLSDVNETEVPAILEVYDHVTVLKGRMPSAAKDARVFLIREKVCDGGCWLNALPEVMEGDDEPEHVVLAMNNTLPNPAEVKDRRSNEVVYSGRIDALLGPCDPRQINAAAAASLIAAPEEMDRLRRAYPPRTAQDKRRDEDLIIRRVIGVP